MRLASLVPSFAFAAIAMCGCATAAQPARDARYCEPPSMRFTAPAEDPVPAGAPRVERLAALLGLHAALMVQGSPAPDVRLRTLERIELSRLQISAASAELDCEGERAEQVAVYLAERESTAEKSLTVGSIVLGAATGIASALLSGPNASTETQEAVAISGGTGTALLGLGALVVHPRVDFAHPRNLLADVWYGPSSSSIYPPTVWSYLTRREFSNEQQRPIREKIVARWRHFQGAVADPEQARLLFGPGGAYDVDTLRARAAMLDEVKAEVELMNQDLSELAAALLRDPGG